MNETTHLLPTLGLLQSPCLLITQHLQPRPGTLQRVRAASDEAGGGGRVLPEVGRVVGLGRVRLDGEFCDEKGVRMGIMPVHGATYVVRYLRACWC